MKTTNFFLLCAILLTACSTPTSIPTATRVKASPAPSSSPSPLPSATFTTTPFPTLVGCVSGVNTLRMREGPGTQYEILRGLPSGTCFNIYGLNQDRSWAWINFDHTFGWVSIQYVSIEGDPNILSIVADNVSPSPFPTEGLVFAYTQSPSFTKTNTPRPVPTNTKKKTATPYVIPTQTIILCANAPANTGKLITCKIPRAYCTYDPSSPGDPTFCNDARYPNHHFTLVVWGSDWSDLDGYCLLVSGYVTTYQGKPQIEATSRSQVSFCR